MCVSVFVLSNLWWCVVRISYSKLPMAYFNNYDVRDDILKSVEFSSWPD